MNEDDKNRENLNRPHDENQPDHTQNGADWWKEHLYGKEKPAEDPNQQYWNGFTDYGRRKTGDPDYGPIPEEYESNPMSRTAFVCGIISVICIFLSMLFPGASFVVGALGILFALLSKRKKFCRQAKTAIVMCSIGMASFALMFLISTAVLVSTGTWDFMMDKIRTMDVNDPNAAAELQQEILDELVRRMGLTVNSDGSITSIGEAGSLENAGQTVIGAAGDQAEGSEWLENSGKEETVL